MSGSDEVWCGIEAVLRSMEIERVVDPATHVARDLDLDSLRRIELAIAVENHFRVRLEPEDEEEIETLGDLAAVVRRRIAEGGTDAGDAGRAPADG